MQEDKKGELRVRINAPSIDVEIIVQEENDLLILDSVIAAIKAKFKKSKIELITNKDT